MKNRKLLIPFNLFPIFLLAGDILQIFAPDNILWTILLELAFLFAIASIPLTVLLIDPKYRKLGVITQVTMLTGALAGACMQPFFRADIVLKNNGMTEAAQFLSNNPSIIFSTMVPGIFFPLSLILLGLGIKLSKVLPAWIAYLTIFGGILFPVGHAVGVAPALVCGDLVILASVLSISRNWKI